MRKKNSKVYANVPLKCTALSSKTTEVKSQLRFYTDFTQLNLVTHMLFDCNQHDNAGYYIKGVEAFAYETTTLRYDMSHLLNVITLICAGYIQLLMTHIPFGWYVGTDFT